MDGEEGVRVGGGVWRGRGYRGGVVGLEGRGEVDGEGGCDVEEGMWMGRKGCGWGGGRVEREEGVWTGRKWRRRGGDRAGTTSDQPCH